MTYRLFSSVTDVTCLDNSFDSHYKRQHICTVQSVLVIYIYIIQYMYQVMTTRFSCSSKNPELQD